LVLRVATFREALGRLGLFRHLPLKTAELRAHRADFLDQRFKIDFRRWRRGLRADACLLANGFDQGLRALGRATGGNYGLQFLKIAAPR
jgi:hypothetical protein